MKVKLDEFYLDVLINGLFQHKDRCFDSTEVDFPAFLLRLVDESEQMKPGRKKKITFQPEEIKLIRRCLLEWRNEEIQAGKEVGIEVVTEALEKFI